MPDFIIKTHNDRNIVIEADRYSFNATERTYEFFKKDSSADTRNVATVLANGEVIAIVENGAEKADFYFRDDEEATSNTGEPCELCGHLDDFLNSEELLDKVNEIVESALFHDVTEEPNSPEQEYPVENNVAPEPEKPALKVETRIYNGNPTEGIVDGEYFLPYLDQFHFDVYAPGDWANGYIYRPLKDCPLAETIQ